ncbi:hypothetical protein ROA7450_01383 [Roseovarius albus]|uniref:DUF1523 domain-containing protein n=1 Tax=Roseovarius albus TaxID=1247867 RepID=A0A1X6YWA3_9RHOB|nr:DUF1523 family protein [Roseovarius albus]SLN31258.1 hypothetical protein ROA7450_01383 [Roseovarius albus]
MIYVKRTLQALILLLVVSFLHYTLPHYDVVRITDTYEKRVDPGSNSIFWSSGDAGSSSEVASRDVFFIQAFSPKDKPRIYRNEDTGWGWPPYMKFDTANLQAEASDLISKKNAENAQWVAVKHYGWRIEMMSVYPNALKIWPVSGPDVRIIPWFNIVFLIVLFALFWAVRVRWKRFRENKINPKVDEWTDGWG